jgi:hypothetical protein
MGSECPLPPCFLEVLILGELERKNTEVLILVGLKPLRISVIEKCRDFLEVLILKGLTYLISPA